MAKKKPIRYDPFGVFTKPKSKPKRKPKPKPKPAPKSRRKPTPLVEYLKDLRGPRRKPKRGLLADFPELDEYFDDMEELLDDEQAEEAEETGNSKEMWFAKSHAGSKVYDAGIKIIKKGQKKWQRKKTAKPRRKLTKTSKKSSKAGFTKKRKISPKNSRKKLTRRRT